ncbi:hypothetical protein GNP44_17665 [Aliivibrio fischeri]|uniref:P-loop NTPase fold protein n=1 Tax=Aliivibrio fischeri TaxID=668 RepID=UPI0012D971CE|nr:P-loop NTPase fold protein [Aliivibrio fischeri]MUK31900.1 hypothetical protein [Aliivibrio fischeri]
MTIDSDNHSAIYKEQNGLCPVSGLPLLDNFHLQYLNPVTQKQISHDLFSTAQEEVIAISPKVNIKIGKRLDELAVMLALPGMRETGEVRLIGNCFMSEYENRYARLDEIRDELSHIDRLIGSRYVIYDYKGGIMSDNLQVLNYLNNKYDGDITIGGDYLTISSTPLHLNKVDKTLFIQKAKSLWQQLFSNNENNSHSENLQKSEINKADNITIKEKKETEPALGVNEISNVLAEISNELTKDSGMMVGIFGRWGRGKTFLANQTISKLINSNDNWYQLNFSAWKYQNTESSWSYLHDSILDTLEKNETDDISIDIEPGIKNKAKRIINKGKVKANNLFNRCKANAYKKGSLNLSFNITIIVALFIWIFLIDKLSLFRDVVSFLTATLFVMLIKSLLFFNATTGIFNNIKQSYFSQKRFRHNLGLQAEIEESIEAMLVTWIPDNSDSKLVMFIDDIDRCDIKSVLDVIDGLRLILDNPKIYKRVIIISAIDERMLRSAIDAKYLSFNKSQRNDIYSEYLQKIFIIGLKLEDLCDNETFEIIDKLLPKIKENTNNLDNKEPDRAPNRKEDVIDISPLETEDSSRSQKFKNAQNYNSTEKVDSDEEGSNEISQSERNQLLTSMTKLNIRTPRSMKIFYYKYLLSKKLLFLSLQDKGLIGEWEKSKHESQLIEHLIAISNKVNVDEIYKNKRTDVEDVIQKVAMLVSAI